MIDPDGRVHERETRGRAEKDSGIDVHPSATCSFVERSFSDPRL